jgi:hypothetical protein
VIGLQHRELVEVGQQRTVCRLFHAPCPASCS